MDARKIWNSSTYRTQGADLFAQWHGLRLERTRLECIWQLRRVSSDRFALSPQGNLCYDIVPYPGPCQLPRKAGFQFTSGCGAIDNDTIIQLKPLVFFGICLMNLNTSCKLRNRFRSPSHFFICSVAFLSQLKDHYYRLEWRTSSVWSCICEG